MMKSMGETIRAFQVAHRLLWGGNMWKALLIPIVLTVLYFPCLIALCYFAAGWMSDGLLSLTPPLGWFDALAEVLLHVLLGLLLGLLGAVTYRAVILIFYSVVLELISERVEIRIRGRKAEDGKTWRQIFLRIVTIALITLALSALLFIVSLMVASIPLIGWAVTVLVIAPAQLFLSGVGYIDPVLDRNGYRARESLALMRCHYATVIWFSLLSSLILLVPIVGWFVGPTYSVVCGVILGVQFDDARRAAKAS